MRTPPPVTETLAQFVVTTALESISEAARARAKLHILDTLGVALAGTEEPAAKITLDYCDKLGASAEASIWGTRRKAAASTAAFANGLLAHALDFDDWDAIIRVGHPSSMIVGAALSLTPEAVVASNEPAAPAASGAFGLAMVFVLLTYGGWNEAAYVSAEVRGGSRAILRTLLISVAAITVIYVAFVASIANGIGFESMRISEAVGIDVMQAVWGAAGGKLIGVIVAIASLTSMNSTMIVGARSNYAVAHEWPQLRVLGRWQGERNTPSAGFIAQALIALALIAFGALEKDGFATMVEFTAPVFWFFFMLNGIAVLVLRRRDPHAQRPFRVPLYPVLPLVFVATCAYLLYSSVVYAQSQNAGYVALAVVAAGTLVLLGMRLVSTAAHRASRTAI